MASTQKKFKTVIEKNTFYFFNQNFEEKYEGYLLSIKDTLLVLKNRVENEGLKKEIFEHLLFEKENGLIALLALTGFSNESLKRLVTLVRVVNDKELNELVYKSLWYTEESLNNIREWSDSLLSKYIKVNKHFRKGIVNLFFEGSSVPFLAKTVPLFELKKLSISKLKFEIPAMIDTLIRYKEKGSYSGKKENNPEALIENILKDLQIPFEKGDLGELVTNAPNNKRTMDFILPNKVKPRVIIESSFLATTSSGQGDKSKTEISIDSLIKRHCPRARFVGFIDGIGWYVRKGDLQRMVSAYEDVFTYHKDELERFKGFMRKMFKR